MWLCTFRTRRIKLCPAYILLPMTYITGGGRIADTRTRTTVDWITESMWGAVNMTILFFRTIYDPDAAETYSPLGPTASQARADSLRGSRGRPGAGGRRIGRVGDFVKPSNTAGGGG